MPKYENYISNLEVLQTARSQDLENEFVQSGVINKFALQFELSWKLLAKLLAYEGLMQDAVGSPRGVIKAAYKAYSFIDEDVWLQMLVDRNTAQHVYDALLSKRLVGAVVESYVPVFEALLASIQAEYDENFLRTL